MDMAETKPGRLAVSATEQLLPSTQESPNDPSDMHVPAPQPLDDQMDAEWTLTDSSQDEKGVQNFEFSTKHDLYVSGPDTGRGKSSHDHDETQGSFDGVPECQVKVEPPDLYPSHEEYSQQCLPEASNMPGQQRLSTPGVEIFKSESGSDIETDSADAKSVMSTFSPTCRNETAGTTSQLPVAADIKPSPFPIALGESQRLRSREWHLGEGMSDAFGQTEALPVGLTKEKTRDVTNKKQKPQKKGRANQITNTKKNPYICSVCDYRSSHKSDFDKHIRIHSGEKPYACAECAYKCTRKSSLVIHTRMHTGEKPYICSSCGLRFPHNSALVEHMRQHTGEKPHTCSQCSFQCAYKSRLIAHMRIHTGEKPHQCSECAYKCANKSALVRHMKIHSGDKPHKCPQCEFTCFYQSVLVTHMRTHTGEKPYVCSVCMTGLAQKSDLNRHMRTHTGEKPFQCPFCDRRCSLKSHLVKHMRTHTVIKE